ncbi:hypothetical protein LJC34_06090 [Oscillospiraceae bacterium OttesenSCG-928-G22]|nr:hypothetical protein [Oscillospiraceae bacterium OttesenSCG-928-G22]
MNKLPIFTAYVASIDLHNPDEVFGRRLSFPATPEDLQDIAEFFGAEWLEEIVYDLRDIQCRFVPNLSEYIPPTTRIDEANTLAFVLNTMDVDTLRRFMYEVNDPKYQGLDDLVSLAGEVKNSPAQARVVAPEQPEHDKSSPSKEKKPKAHDAR